MWGWFEKKPKPKAEEGVVRPLSADELRKIRDSALARKKNAEEKERAERLAEEERNRQVEKAKRRVTIGKSINDFLAQMPKELAQAAREGKNTAGIRFEESCILSKEEIAELQEFKKLKSFCDARGYILELKTAIIRHSGNAEIGLGSSSTAYTYLEVRF